MTGGTAGTAAEFVKCAKDEGPELLMVMFPDVSPSIFNSQVDIQARVTTPIAVAYGDGIGPKVMTAVLRISRNRGVMRASPWEP